MSALVDRAIAAAGLGHVAEARRAGDVDAIRESLTAWRDADLLALGALADQIRIQEVGDTVRIHAGKAAEIAIEDAQILHPSGGARGLLYLREIAVLRIAGRFAARVLVDWNEVGFELAQVALGFGASELSGPIANKRGLPIADDATRKVKGQGMVSAQLLKMQELTKVLACVGRRAVFAGEEETGDAEVSHA